VAPLAVEPDAVAPSVLGVLVRLNRRIAPTMTGEDE